MAARFPPLDLPSSVLGEARKAILDLEAKSDNKTITLAERKLTTPRTRRHGATGHRVVRAAVVRAAGRPDSGPSPAQVPLVDQCHGSEGRL